MAVTTHMQALEVESVLTRIPGLRRMQDALCHEGQSLSGLESGAWRILSHNTAIKQGLPHVLTQLSVTGRALPAHHHAWVIGR